MKNWIVVIATVLVGGCSVGPDYQRPETEAPQSWQYADSSYMVDSSMVTSADTSWWEGFGDTVLTALVETTLQNNADVRIAAARVEQYMGLYGVAKSDFFPKIGAGADASRGQIRLTPTGEDKRPTINQFDVTVSAAWEIDLWGKVRRATEAARADLLGAEEARRAVTVSVVGLVVDSYIQLLALDKQLDVAHRTLASREKSLSLFQQRFTKGDVSELEMAQIESQYWVARARVPVLERSIAFQENALSVLLGRNPGSIPRGSVIDSLQMPRVPENLPSELLEQRPDVRQAEEQLRAANARIGVAKAQYFPSISLTGVFGTASSDLSKLFTPNAQIWNIGGSILQPIFRWGEISGQVTAAEAFQRQMLEEYVRAVQNAFADAEDALVSRSRTQEERDAVARQVAALRSYERLSQMRYREGVTSYLEVLDAERSLFDTELGYAQTQANLLQTVVGLYRAFGGGWTDWVAWKAELPEDPVETRVEEEMPEQERKELERLQEERLEQQRLEEGRMEQKRP
jgi:outer membrane protein, multidrug efflux system